MRYADDEERKVRHSRKKGSNDDILEMVILTRQEKSNNGSSRHKIYPIPEPDLEHGNRKETQDIATDPVGGRIIRSTIIKS